MAITIEPYTYKINAGSDHEHITYWGVFLDDMEISSTSTKEKAQETKEWMESWLTVHH